VKIGHNTLHKESLFIQLDEIKIFGWAVLWMWEIRNIYCVQNFSGKPLEKHPLERKRRI
jgi:hypothetical protein